MEWCSELGCIHYRCVFRLRSLMAVFTVCCLLFTGICCEQQRQAEFDMGREEGNGVNPGNMAEHAPVYINGDASEDAGAGETAPQTEAAPKTGLLPLEEISAEEPGTAVLAEYEWTEETAPADNSIAGNFTVVRGNEESAVPGTESITDDDSTGFTSDLSSDLTADDLADNMSDMTSGTVGGDLQTEPDINPSVSGTDITGTEEDTSGNFEESVNAGVMLPQFTADGVQITDTVDGFLVDEEGMICGIAEPEQVAQEGYMELPYAGCNGIAAGAFLNAPAGIREMYIPSNITVIEEGALQGLSQMEWIEMEDNGIYFSEDGVLFADGGTCLLAFPAARIGDYKVPAQVTRFAADAFADSKLDMVEAVESMLADVGNIPDRIRLLTDVFGEPSIPAEEENQEMEQAVSVVY